jgi:cation-transporting P-type ATPase E
MEAGGQGLTGAEVADRVARGLVNDVPDAPTRTVGQILRANVLTPFNLLLGSLLAVILVVGPLQDALFGLVLVGNVLVGVVQEVRAKRTLERLAVVAAPKARVLRGDREAEVAVGRVVLDDLLLAGPGDQLVVDGEVVDSATLEVDESLLTGESEPVAKQPGDEVLSGSFVAAGSGAYRAARVGRDAYAARLASDARRFTLARSELRAGIDRIVRLIAWVLVPTAALLLASQVRAHASLHDALRGAVAGTVAMVPEGLVLLTSVAFAVSVVRLGRRNVLVQELPAVETLARVDVVCFDKTGTITEGDLAVQELVRLPGGDGAEAVLGALAAADPSPNATLRAIGERCPSPAGWSADRVLPFSSARKWSAATFAGRGTWLLGAPEVLLAAADGPRPAGGALLRRTEALATEGKRVVLLAAAPEPVPSGADSGPPAAGPGSRREGEGRAGGQALPSGLVPRAFVVLGDRVREDAAATVGWFLEEGVATRVLSGDHPRTVAAVAARVGVPGADAPVDARTLPTDPAALAAVLEQRSVFGRVVPRQKRAMVHALQGRGHAVAMTGDGVNDVLALKDADLGIAMGSGSAASRAVARVVLLHGRFASLPQVVAEGRRVIANVERVAKLFLTKTVYAMLLAVATGVAALPFPFLPRHLTLVGSLTADPRRRRPAGAAAGGAAAHSGPPLAACRHDGRVGRGARRPLAARLLRPEPAPGAGAAVGGRAGRARRRRHGGGRPPARPTPAPPSARAPARTIALGGSWLPRAAA